MGLLLCAYNRYIIVVILLNFRHGNVVFEVVTSLKCLVNIVNHREHGEHNQTQPKYRQLVDTQTSVQHTVVLVYWILTPEL